MTQELSDITTSRHNHSGSKLVNSIGGGDVPLQAQPPAMDFDIFR
jgi:hypothetical protein